MKNKITLSGLAILLLIVYAVLKIIDSETNGIVFLSYYIGFAVSKWHYEN